MSATVHHRFEDDPRKGFASPTAFLTAIMAAGHAQDRDEVKDERLRAQAARSSGADPLAFMLPRGFAPGSIRAAVGSDEQGAYADPYGGFLQGSELAPYALGRVEEDPTSGRTLAIPMSEPKFSIPVRTSGDRSESVTGGLVVTRSAEAVDPGTSRGGFELVTLEASTLLGIAFATEQILGRDPRAFIAILASGFRDEMSSALLREKLVGRGGAEYLGVTNSGARITVDAEEGQSADTINGTNVAKMRRRCWGFRRAIWLANLNTYEALLGAHLATAAGAKWLYVQSSVDGLPDMLAGRPIFYTEHLPTLGDEGDVCLVDWSQFLEGTYLPLTSDESIHVRFDRLERAFRFYTRNAGSPWWRAPITPAVGSDSLSPIVTLAAR
ncbi:MAG TPA: phage major capsid protein [Longimicrobiales bacterium]|nr:phage major capsid protein [Longimicrobiales bacterium]